MQMVTLAGQSAVSDVSGQHVSLPAPTLSKGVGCAGLLWKIRGADKMVDLFEAENDVVLMEHPTSSCSCCKVHVTSS